MFHNLSFKLVIFRPIIVMFFFYVEYKKYLMYAKNEKE